MRAAIYARKSTDDNDRHADNKSVTRQIDNARAYAERRGWAIDDDHVYVDDGISGADFTRPALLRMLNSLRDFDVVVMSEFSRLGREQCATNKILADLHAKGVRVFFYLTDEELNFESAVDKFMVSAVAFAAELEREKASQRARDALARKAAKGYNAGGVVFGYDNVPITTTNAAGELVRSHTDYKINAEQAEVVRAIFRMRAEGLGFVTIAKTLNGDPSCAAHSQRFLDNARPASPRKGTGSWAPSSVRGILFNERYLGKVPFGKFRKVYRGGAKARVKTDALEWADRPDLRIVGEELWAAAQQHSAAAARTYLRGTDGQLWGRPGMGAESKYLLTALGRCSVCGGNLKIMGGTVGPTGKRRRVQYYTCAWNHSRGETVCTNDHRVRRERLEAAVLEALEQQVLTPEVAAAAVERAMQLVAERRRKHPERPQQIDRELRKLRRELGNLLALAAAGKAPQSIMAEITKREEAIAGLESEREQLSAQPHELDRARLRKALAERAGRFRELLAGDTVVARQALRKLLVEPLRFTPTTDADGKRALAFEGKTKVGPLLDPTFLRMASPTGPERYAGCCSTSIRSAPAPGFELHTGRLSLPWAA